MPGRDGIARIVGVLFAVAACAWYVLGVRQAHSVIRADSILAAHQRIPAADARTVASLLDEAGTLNPDRHVDIDRIHLLLERGRTQAAQRLAGALTRAEPRNLDVWLWLAHAAGVDQPLFAYALGQAR